MHGRAVIHSLLVVTLITIVTAVAHAQVVVRDHRTRPAPVQTLTISGFAPRVGPAGTKVTITGAGFVPQDKVFIGGRPVAVDKLTPASVTITIPARSFDGLITVRHPGAATDTLVGTFMVIVDPVIGGFAPVSGPAGTRVELKGSGFQQGDQVVFGGRALPILEQGPHRLVVAIPLGATTDVFAVARPGGATARATKPFLVVLPAPQITSLAPTTGGPGTRVRIFGANLTDNSAPYTGVALRAPAKDQVSYGTMPVSIEASADGWVDVTVPKSARTSEQFVLRGPRGQSASAQPFILVLAPELTRFAPAWGGVGVRVQLFGANFRIGDVVQLAGKPLRVHEAGEEHLIVEIPAGVTSGPFEIVRGGQVAAATKRPFEVVYPPTLAGFTPAAGPIGQVVTLSGTGFAPEARVVFGAQALRIVGRVGDTQLQVAIPPGASTQPFAVETRGGRATSALTFQVNVYSTVTGIAPLDGPPGTRITVRGRDFGSDVFYIGAVSLAVIERGADFYVLQIPANAATGLVEWESHGVRKATRFRFDVLQPPAITSFAPGFGPAGTQVTITGANLGPKTAAFFGSLPCTVVRRSPPGQLTIAIPPAASGTDFLWVEAAGARVKSSQAFQVVAPPVIGSFSPAAALAGTEITVSGANFTDASTVRIGSTPAPIVRRQLPDKLVVTLPAGVVGAAHLWVDDRGQQARSATELVVIAPPSLAGFAPLVGLPGTQVTLSGTSIGPGTKVFLGTLECKALRHAVGQIVIVIPTGAAVGKHLLIVEALGLRAQSAQPFEVLAAPVAPPEPDAHHEHAHAHPHGPDDHHHHAHAHPHRSGGNHHHPF